MRKIIILLAVFLGITAINAQVLINEFEPNPPGRDPSIQNIELVGTPNTSFTGVLVSVEADNDAASASIGKVEYIEAISGNFDANGVLVASIPNLENPSYTLILLNTFSGSIGDALNVTTIQPDVLDAIGLLDNNSDAPNLIADQLGGVNIIAPSRVEPTLLFRDSVSNAIYVVINGDIFDVNGDDIPVTNFDGDPTTPSFGVANFSAEDTPVLSIADNKIKNALITLYPNPVRSNRRVTIDTSFTGEVNMEVFNVLGVKVMEAISVEKGINVESLRAGMYLVKFKIKEAIIITKLMVI